MIRCHVAPRRNTYTWHAHHKGLPACTPPPASDISRDMPLAAGVAARDDVREITVDDLTAGMWHSFPGAQGAGAARAAGAAASTWRNETVPLSGLFRNVSHAAPPTPSISKSAITVVETTRFLRHALSSGTHSSAGALVVTTQSGSVELLPLHPELAEVAQGVGTGTQGASTAHSVAHSPRPLHPLLARQHCDTGIGAQAVMGSDGHVHEFMRPSRAAIAMITKSTTPAITATTERTIMVLRLHDSNMF
jgi:hypothetical protein